MTGPREVLWVIKLLHLFSTYTLQQSNLTRRLSFCLNLHVILVPLSHQDFGSLVWGTICNTLVKKMEINCQQNLITLKTYFCEKLWIFPLNDFKSVLFQISYGFI